MTLAPSPQARLSQGEFIALIAMLFATIALSIDAMLPALPDIASSLSPGAPNRAQLVITSFVLGMGIGTLVAGPLSDRFGRKRIILLGSGLYALAAVACYLAQTLESLLLARVVMGIGAAGPRTVSLAMVRDLFSGREMARVMSFAMVIFTLVPAVAPLMGAGVIALADWHAIFLVYVLFAGVSMLWLGLRQPETLPPQSRQSLRLSALLAATREVLSHRIIRLSVIVQALTLAALFATLSSMQGIFEAQFDRADSFPMWFAVIALGSMSGGFLNARLVMRMGMARVAVGTYGMLLAVTALHLGLAWSGVMPPGLAFGAHILWSMALFAMMGLTMGNLNALAMDPVGHVAGLAASVISSLATVVSVALAIPVGLALDGTNLPLLVGVTVFTGLALVAMRVGMAPRSS